MSDMILGRLNDQIAWYSAKSRQCRTNYYRSEFITLISAALIPALAGQALPYVTYVISSLGVIITIARGAAWFNQYSAKWLDYRNTAESLKHEKFLFIAKAGPYANLYDPIQVLAERVEALISQESSQWVASVQKNSQPPVAVAFTTSETQDIIESDWDGHPVSPELLEQVFNTVKAGRQSGWEIAKTIEVDPQLVSKALNQLRKRRLINSNGLGLNGYYYLTSDGFSAKGDSGARR